LHIQPINELGNGLESNVCPIPTPEYSQQSGAAHQGNLQPAKAQPDQCRQNIAILLLLKQQQSHFNGNSDAITYLQ
jgi:hypothetical protein